LRIQTQKHTRADRTENKSCFAASLAHRIITDQHILNIIDMGLPGLFWHRELMEDERETGEKLADQD